MGTEQLIIEYKMGQDRNERLFWNWIETKTQHGFIWDTAGCSNRLVHNIKSLQ